MAKYDVFISFHGAGRKISVEAQNLKAVSKIMREKLRGVHNGFMVCPQARNQHLDEAIDRYGVHVGGQNTRFSMEITGSMWQYVSGKI